MNTNRGLCIHNGEKDGLGVLQNKACRKIFGCEKRGSVSDNLNSVHEYEGFYWGYVPSKERVNFQYYVF